MLNPKKNATPGRTDRLPYVTGAFLVAVTGFLFYAFFVDVAIRHNNFMGYALMFPPLLTIIVCLGRKFCASRYIRYPRIILFGLITVVSGLSVFAMRVPINVISMEAGPIFASSHFVLEPEGTRSRRRHLHEFASRDDPEVRVNFYLRWPIRRKKQPSQ